MLAYNFFKSNFFSGRSNVFSPVFLVTILMEYVTISFFFNLGFILSFVHLFLGFVVCLL